MTERPIRPSDERALERLSDAIASVGLCLPGSIVERHMRCGKTSCACRSDPARRHGPYLQWTRRGPEGTITRYLSPEQLERYQPWIDNARRLRTLLAELEALSARIAERAEGWDGMGQDRGGEA